MDVLDYIVNEALILIPALLIVGKIIKKTQHIDDKYIPLIILVLGVATANLYLGLSADSSVQGVLVAGAAVFGNELYKQMKDPN